MTSYPHLSASKVARASAEDQASSSSDWWRRSTEHSDYNHRPSTSPATERRQQSGSKGQRQSPDAAQQDASTEFSFASVESTTRTARPMTSPLDPGGGTRPHGRGSLVGGNRASTASSAWLLPSNSGVASPENSISASAWPSFAHMTREESVTMHKAPNSPSTRTGGASSVASPWATAAAATPDDGTSTAGSSPDRFAHLLTRRALLATAGSASRADSILSSGHGGGGGGSPFTSMRDRRPSGGGTVPLARLSVSGAGPRQSMNGAGGGGGAGDGLSAGLSSMRVGGSLSRPSSLSRRFPSRRVIDVPMQQGPALPALVTKTEDDDLEAAASLTAMPSSVRLGTPHSAHDHHLPVSTANTPKPLAHYQMALAQQLAAQAAANAEPAQLPGAEDVPPELRALFSEMQQYGLKQSVGDTLGLSAKSVRDRYLRTSVRVDNLPSALCRTATGLMLVPLPGKRGVPGWRVNGAGNVAKASGVGGYLGMSPNVETVKRMQEELEKTYAEEHGAAGAAGTSAPSSPERERDGSAWGGDGRPVSKQGTSRVRFGAGGNSSPASNTPPPPMGPLAAAAAAAAVVPAWASGYRRPTLEELYPIYNRYVATAKEARHATKSGQDPRTIHDHRAKRGLAEAVQKACDMGPDWTLESGNPPYPVFEPSDDEVEEEFLFLTQDALPEDPAGPTREPLAFSRIASLAASSQSTRTRHTSRATTIASRRSSKGGAAAGASAIASAAGPASAAAKLLAGTAGGATGKGGLGAAARAAAAAAAAADPPPPAAQTGPPPKASAAHHHTGVSWRPVSPGTGDEDEEENAGGPSGGSGADSDGGAAAGRRSASPSDAVPSRPSPHPRGSGAAVGAPTADPEAASRSGAEPGAPSDPGSAAAAAAAAAAARTASPLAEVVTFAASSLMTMAPGNRHALATGAAPLLDPKLVDQLLEAEARSEEADDPAQDSPSEEDAALDAAFEELHAVLQGARKVRQSHMRFKDAAAKVVRMLGIMGRLATEEDKELEQKVESMFSQYLLTWGDGLVTGESQVLSLQRLKEVLIPKALKPPPPEMQPFEPKDGEPMRVSATQVRRRLQQCLDNHDPVLDLAIVPRLTRGDFGVVFQALKDCHGAQEAITHVSATHNLLSVSGAEGLWALLRANPAITDLDVHKSAAIGPVQAEALGALLQPSLKLHLARINLSRCPVGDEGFTALAQHMQFNRNMRVLNLSGTGLTDASLAGLESFFKENCFLTSLDLAGNRFTQAGIKSLSTYLLANHSLLHLGLTDCGLTDEAARHLSQLLSLNPTLDRLELANNSIAWAGARGLAEGLQAAVDSSGRCLQELVLDNNPLGHMAVIELMKAMQASPLMPQISVTGCTLDPLRGQPVYFDPSYPNGSYTLDLANLEHRDVAARLVTEVWLPSGGASWVSAQLAGRRLVLREGHGWPAAMPTEGTLKVQVVSALSVQEGLPPYPGAADPAALAASGRRPHQLMSQRLESAAEEQLGQHALSDVWRMGYIELLTNVAHVTAAQTVRLLRHFVYRKEKLVATRMLLSVTVDVHALGPSLCAPPPAGVLDADDMLDLLNLLGLGAVTPHKAPLEPGWQLACSGHYNLNLGIQVQRWFAALLVELGERQDRAMDPLAAFQAPPSSATSAAMAGADAAAAAHSAGYVVRLGDCRSRMLNVVYSGTRLDPQVLFLLSSMLPTQGTLSLHFFNVALTRYSMQRLRPCRLAFISPLLEVQTAQHRSAAEHVALCGSDWETLFQGLLRSMRLLSDGPKVGTWRQAARAWSRATAGPLVEQMRDQARVRHLAYAAEEEERQKKEAEAAAEAAAAAAESAAAGGKKGKKGAGGKKKGGAKGGGKGGKAAGKAAAAAAKAAAAAADAQAAHVQAAVTAAHALLPQVIKYSITRSLTCCQLCHLLRLFPDLHSRLLLLEALQPCLWDPAWLVDVVLDLDHPVMMPLPKEEYERRQQEAQMVHTLLTKGSGGSGKKAGDAAVGIGGESSGGDRSRGAASATHAVASAAPSAEPSSAAAAAAPGGEGSAGGGATAAAADGSADAAKAEGTPAEAAVPEEPSPVLPPGFSKSAHVPSFLLSLAASRLGWCRLQLPWVRPHTLDGIAITLDLSLAEHLQCLARLCRFSDCFAFAAIDAALARAKHTNDLAVAGPVMTELHGDGGAFEVDSMGGPALDQVMGYCCMSAPSAGLSGTLSLQLCVSELHQRHAAAVMIQATWRGHRTRMRQYALVKAMFERNRWRAAWGCYVWLRRLAFMRRLATDLSISRMLMQLQANTSMALQQQQQQHAAGGAAADAGLMGGQQT